MGFKIYGLERLVNHKIYVGKTSRTLEERIARHKRANSFVGRAIRKYGGEKSFIAVILAECETNDEANELEKFWIAKLNCKVPNGYNLTDGGDGPTGVIISQETKAKISKSLKGYSVSEKTRRKLSEAAKNASDETRDKISKTLKGRKLNAEHCANISAAQIGRMLSKKMRQKISNSHKGMKASNEARSNMSKAQKARFQREREKKNLDNQNQS